jgi:hypothetical protein
MTTTTTYIGGSGPKKQNFQLALQTLTLTCKVTSTCGMDVPVSELQRTRGKTFSLSITRLRDYRYRLSGCETGSGRGTGAARVADTMI